MCYLKTLLLSSPPTNFLCLHLQVATCARVEYLSCKVTTMAELDQ
ncbi:hypothetical protein COLO4_35469 [Corchorus olitorius]|uniref:Uncharacterized protein n=1 Tax=Corchorus olitorius TaxID=93759 RepID=A0A1R3GGQ2_9ROSI|nr:hypothetical protein COLO4_35469 [Corchorus olitorius]